MNILVLDFGLSKTHVDLNKRYFELLSQLGNVYIVNSGGYYDSLGSNPNIKLLETNIVQNQNKIRRLFKRPGSVIGRAMCVDAMVQNRRAIKGLGIKFDYTLIMGYEIITFVLYPMLFQLKNTYLFQHQQITELESSIKRHFFMKYANKVKHIVLDDIFKDYLKKYVVNNVYTVHYIRNKDLIEKYEQTKNNNGSEDSGKRYISISNTNDENKVHDIIQLEKKTGFFEKNKITYHVRSKQSSFNNGYLIVDNEYLSTDDYYKEICEATANISLLSDNYGYRLSGWLLDAALCGIPSYCPRIPLAEEMQKTAPSLFCCYEGTEELQELLEKHSFFIDDDQVNALRSICSDQGVLGELRKAFEVD